MKKHTTKQPETIKELSPEWDVAKEDRLDHEVERLREFLCPHCRGNFSLSLKDGVATCWNTESYKELEAEAKKLKKELQTERIRLAACGIAALGYFNGCCDNYKSGSLGDVLKLREKCEKLEAVVEAWTNEGPNPKYHREQKELLKKNWRPLWEALRKVEEK